MTDPLLKGYNVEEEATMAALFDLLGTTEWQDRAECKGRADAMFVQRGHTIDEARTICGACPVRAECLQASAASMDTWRFGVWGGLPQGQRDLLDREVTKRGEQGDPFADGWVGVRRALPPIIHDTVNGYNAHLLRGVPVCELCRGAKNREKAKQKASGRRLAVVA